MTIYLCDRCERPIGVYEPTIVVIDGAQQRTSVAARPDLTDAASHRYHLECRPGDSRPATP